jgi:uncharacterized protein
MKTPVNMFVRIALLAGLCLAVSMASADDKVDFFRAVAVDNTNTVNKLLAAGFDPNTLDEKGQLALTLALRDDSPKVVKALLAHPGIKLDATNSVGETPLMLAALRGNLEVATALLERGAAVDKPGWTALHYAASGQSVPMVHLLVARFANLEAESPNKTTPLMMASRYGSEAVALALLAKGASPKAKNDQGLDAAAFAKLAARDKLAKKMEDLAR